MSEQGPKETKSEEMAANDIVDSWIAGQMTRYDGSVYAVEQVYEDGPVNLIRIDPPSLIQRALGRVTGLTPRNRATFIEEVMPAKSDDVSQ